MSFVRQVDMRYAGQSYELTVPLSDGALNASGLAELVDHFHQAHDRANGFSAPGEPVELVNLRVTAIGRLVKPQLEEMESRPGVPVEPKQSRPVFFNGTYLDCPIYDRDALAADSDVTGPAIVEERDSATVVHPGFSAIVDRFGNLMLTPVRAQTGNHSDQQSMGKEVHDWITT
jgi:N-methylhydantoinase A